MDPKEQHMIRRLEELGVDRTTRFMFYSMSKHVDAGKGAQETRPKSEEMKERFQALDKHTHWRRHLSNLTVVNPFQCDLPNEDGKFRQTKECTSIEQAFQAGKFSLCGYNDECEVILAVSSGVDARKLRKIRRLTKTELSRWNAIKFQFMERLQQARFLSDDVDPVGQTILRLTGKAHLIHTLPRTKAHGTIGRHGFVDNSQYSLMRVRNELFD